MQNQLLKVLGISVIASLLLHPLKGMSESLNGAQEYVHQCGRCHNLRGPMEKSDRDWDIIVGHMRSVGDLTGEQSRAILEFLQANNNPPLNQGTGNDAGLKGVSGKQIFVSHSCVACHRLGDEGGGTGPSLDNVSSRRSRDYIVDQIRDPRLHNPVSIMPPTNLSSQELETLLKYLESGK